jgi:hypothetical protein
MPVPASRSGLVQGELSLSESIVGAHLIFGLAELGGEAKRLLLEPEGQLRAPGGVVEPAQAVEGLELPVTAADLPGDLEGSVVVFGGRFAAVPEPADVAQAGQRGQLDGARTRRPAS